MFEFRVEGFVLLRIMENPVEKKMANTKKRKVTWKLGFGNTSLHISPTTTESYKEDPQRRPLLETAHVDPKP